MNLQLIPNLEKLKKEVLRKAGIKHASPSACGQLADIIKKTTGKRISETTLKRVYGFAHGQFTPSLFTLDVLAEFSDDMCWMDFCEKQKKEGEKLSDSNRHWEIVGQSTSKITH